MHYLLSWSGGKDSTASIILAHENNEPLDTIVFCEVMYDLKNNISGENPEHIKFIKEEAKPLFESWGYKVEILMANQDYLDFFIILLNIQENIWIIKVKIWISLLWTLRSEKRFKAKTNRSIL